MSDEAWAIVATYLTLMKADVPQRVYRLRAVEERAQRMNSLWGDFGHQGDVGGEFDPFLIHGTTGILFEFGYEAYYSC